MTHIFLKAELSIASNEFLNDSEKKFEHQITSDYTPDIFFIRLDTWDLCKKAILLFFMIIISFIL